MTKKTRNDPEYPGGPLHQTLDVTDWKEIVDAGGKPRMLRKVSEDMDIKGLGTKGVGELLLAILFAGQLEDLKDGVDIGVQSDEAEVRLPESRKET